jgi:hypothetical protein
MSFSVEGMCLISHPVFHGLIFLILKLGHYQLPRINVQTNHHFQTQEQGTPRSFLRDRLTEARTLEDRDELRGVTQ